MTVKKPTHKKSAATEAKNSKDGFSLISNEKLLELYTAMLKCRKLVERTGSQSQKKNLSGNFETAVGREAIAAGVAIDLVAGDALSCSHNDIMPRFIKGVPLDRILSSIVVPVNGRRKRSVAAGGGYGPLNIIPPSSTLSTQLQIACGVALANKMAKNGRITVAFCGEGSESFDSIREALSFAGLHRLAIVFVFHVGLHSETKGSIAQSKVEDIVTSSQTCGVPAITVDGNDVVAVYRVAYESINRARQGRGPTLIESKAYRHHLPGSSGIGIKRIKGLPLNDPIRNMETYLDRKGLFNKKLKRQINAGFGKELDTASRFFSK